MDQLGVAAQDAENELASRGEAKKVAFLLFWYIKPYIDRWQLNPATGARNLKNSARTGILAVQWYESSGRKCNAILYLYAYPDCWKT